jgi:hypothetical protein
MISLKDVPKQEKTAANLTTSLLSKHNGWITVDAINLRRSEAPESF